MAARASHLMSGSPFPRWDCCSPPPVALRVPVHSSVPPIPYTCQIILRYCKKFNRQKTAKSQILEFVKVGRQFHPGFQALLYALIYATRFIYILLLLRCTRIKILFLKRRGRKLLVGPTAEKTKIQRPGAFSRARVNVLFLDPYGTGFQLLYWI